MAGPPDHEPIGLRLTRVARTVSRAFDAVLAEAGGSLPVWLILVSLKARTYGAQSEIAAAVGIEGATLTHHLNRMEAAGLVTRRRDPANRRTHQVEITADGEKLFFALLQRVLAFDEQLRAGFSERDLTQLGRHLDRMAANTSAANHERSSR
jgi:MarR family transcriptional regulator, transcriptional regulator for hemolysin